MAATLQINLLVKLYMQLLNNYNDCYKIELSKEVFCNSFSQDGICIISLVHNSLHEAQNSLSFVIGEYWAARFIACCHSLEATRMSAMRGTWAYSPELGLPSGPGVLLCIASCHRTPPPLDPNIALLDLDPGVGPGPLAPWPSAEVWCWVLGPILGTAQNGGVWGETSKIPFLKKAL